MTHESKGEIIIYRTEDGLSRIQLRAAEGNRAADFGFDHRAHDLPPPMRFRPKNNGPDHLLPVMTRAMEDRLL